MRTVGIVLGMLLGMLASSAAAEEPTYKLRLGVASLAERWRPGYHKIGAIEKGSPAEAIGLKPGYVIVAIDGKVVGAPDKVRKDIRKKDKIYIIYHNGKQLYQVVADLEGGDSYKFGGRVIGKPERRAIVPSKGASNKER